MDVIEFLKKTDHRNLKYNIDYLVKEKLKEYDLNLNERRERLRQLLESENMLYEKELILLQKARDEEKETKRHEWIGLMRLDRKRNEEELLKIKQRQRELENSEEFKHMQSQEMLLDSKQTQLYQMEEKKILREKQAKIEQFWLDTMQKYNEEKEYHEIKEQKLRKCIADIGQQINLNQNAELKVKKEKEAEELRKEFHEENMRAWNINQKYKKDEEFYEWRKKVHHKDALERQIHHNTVNPVNPEAPLWTDLKHFSRTCKFAYWFERSMMLNRSLFALPHGNARAGRVNNAIQRQVDEVSANQERKQIQETILMEINRKDAETIKNRSFQKEYLEHIFNEKKSTEEIQKEFDGMFIGTGCVLEQKDKRPYNKNSR